MKTKNKRCLKVPLSMCRSMNEIKHGEHILYGGYYEHHFDGKDLLIDILKTDANRFYVRITDTTDDKYDEIDFNEFKRKYAQPTLFDFLDI